MASDGARQWLAQAVSFAPHAAAFTMEHPAPMDPYQEQRSCKVCDVSYTIQEFYDSNCSYFYPPDDYGRGCYDHCLACWLGVGPKDFPPLPDDGSGAVEIIYPRATGYSPGKGYSPGVQYSGSES